MGTSVTASPETSDNPHGNRPTLPGRACGTCTLCCKVAEVLEMSKPMGVWCPHCLRNKGCSIYETRPASCRIFQCEWLVEKSLGPEWKPERAKFALARSEGG